MTWLANKLRERIQIKYPSQGAGLDGGFARGYETIGTIWAEVVPVPVQRQQMGSFLSYVRGAQLAQIATHICTVRRTAVATLGGAFSKSIGRGFASQADLEILKNNYFVFRNMGDTTGGQFGAGFDNQFNQVEGLIGELFKIIGYEDVNSRKEYLKLRLTAVEEQGTGAGV